MSHIRVFTIFCLLILSVLEANAAANSAYGTATVDVVSERVQDTSATGETVNSERHLRLGLESGWNFALTEKHSVFTGLVFNSDRGAIGGSESNGYALGVGVGWLHEHLSIAFRYFFLGEMKSTANSIETQYSDASGFALTARWFYWWDLSNDNGGNSRIGFGPSLTFERMRFSKSRVGSLPETNNGRVVESTRPGLAAYFIF